MTTVDNAEDPQNQKVVDPLPKEEEKKDDEKPSTGTAEVVQEESSDTATSTLVTEKKPEEVVTVPLEEVHEETVSTNLPPEVTSPSQVITGLTPSTPNRSPTPGTPCSDGRKMNGLSFSELCCLFCCPPCPGQIASKLAFLPPEPTYSFVPDETSTKFTLSLTDRAEWQYSQRELDSAEAFYARSSRGNRIGCIYIRTPNPRYTILFSHGNAVDLGQMSSFYVGLGSRIKCNIFSYDYSGYGVSTGLFTQINHCQKTILMLLIPFQEHRRRKTCMPTLKLHGML